MVSKAVKKNIKNNVNEVIGKEGPHSDTLLRSVLMAYFTTATPQVSNGESHVTYSTVGILNCLLL